MDPLSIEEKEREVMAKIACTFTRYVRNFKDDLNRSLEYIDYILIPTIMASSENRSHNPFAEIIEKYSTEYMSKTLEVLGYKPLPLGYSSDLTMEGDDHILNLDVKSANLDNESDFKGTINLGVNQFSHSASFKNLVINGEMDFLKVYPSIPPVYSIKGKKKLVLTYGLLVIYKPYKDLLNPLKEDYEKLHNIIYKHVIVLNPKIKQKKKNGSYEPISSDSDKMKTLVRNVLRGLLIHKLERDELIRELDLTPDEVNVIEEFERKIREVSDQFKDRLNTVALLLISIPNGLLEEKYKGAFVSGKGFGESARYHYSIDDYGYFKYILERGGRAIPRVVLLYADESIEDELVNALRVRKMKGCRTEILIE